MFINFLILISNFLFFSQRGENVILQWIPFTYPCPYLVQFHYLVPFEGQVLLLFQLTLLPPIFSNLMSVHTVYAGNSFVHTINKSYKLLPCS